MSLPKYILDFNPENLAVSLSNEHTSKEEIERKAHYGFLLKYLDASCLNAQKIVIEEEYISRDYIHDYAAYIAFSFKNYAKKCKRIHFFSCEFSQEQFESAILHENSSVGGEIWDHYLGFIVVKPIPTTVIGYTLLKIPPNVLNQQSRKFTRTHQVHLFGCSTTIESLAFQEQDTVLSACATTAIWIMLNKASAADNAILKSPSQITLDAGLVKTDNRLFPNREGLKVAQLVHAIRESGLEAEITTGKVAIPTSNPDGEGKYLPHSQIRRVVQAYSSLGIPLLLLTKINFEGRSGYHAMAISGFRYGPTMTDPEELPEKRLNLKADSIDEIYVHDDQIGPYAPISFSSSPSEIETEWKVYRGALSTNVVSLVVPTYPKVRITYREIEALIIEINGIIKGFVNFGEGLPSKKMMGWDIRLRLSEDYKVQVRESKLAEKAKMKLLKASMPKYVWVASLLLGGSTFVDFVFDATDLSSSMTLDHTVLYMDKQMTQAFYDFVVEAKAEIVKLEYFTDKFYSALLKHIEQAIEV